MRAYRGWPQAFTWWAGRTVKILRAWPLDHAGEPGVVKIVDGVPVVSGLRLDELVLEGKRAQSGPEFVRGYPGFVGARLGA